MAASKRYRVKGNAHMLNDNILPGEITPMDGSSMVRGDETILVERPGRGTPHEAVISSPMADIAGSLL